MATDVGRLAHSRADEEFWLTVLRWFCQHPLLDRRQVGPLLDYVAHRRGEDPAFSMKGRSPLAMLRAMREWHGLLARERVLKGVVFKPSGYKSLIHKTREDGKGSEIVWTVDEILTSKALAAEGSDLRHCVYSYVRAIEQGNTAIWSLRCDGQRAVTIEVRNDARQIVQARGARNRYVTSAEYAVIARWAQDNGLLVTFSRIF